MPRKCKICDHDRRQEITLALLHGESLRSIAQQFTVSRGVVARHLRHISDSVRRAQELMDLEHGKSILLQLRELGAQARDVGLSAERTGDRRTVLAALRETTRILELEARLTGELNEKPEAKILNVNIDPGTARRITETFLARHKGTNPT